VDRTESDRYIRGFPLSKSLQIYRKPMPACDRAMCVAFLRATAVPDSANSAASLVWFSAELSAECHAVVTHNGTKVVEHGASLLCSVYFSMHLFWHPMCFIQ
jgi:hypothetical protein